MSNRKRGIRPMQFATMLVVVFSMVLSLVPTWALADELSQVQTDDVPNEEQLIEVTTPDDANEEEGATDGDASKDVVEPGGSAEEEIVVSTSDDEEDPQESVQQVDETVVEEEASVEETAEVKPESSPTGDVHVYYQGHVQNKGWLKEVKDGAIGGTSGKSLRVEAMRIRVNADEAGIAGGISYRVHVQDKGWMDWVNDGAEAGTQGEAKRLEAIQIKLYGDIADEYDVYYTVHAQNKGWLAWAKNGSSSGTAGQSLRLEAVKVVLVKKNGGTKPDSSFVNLNRSFDAPMLVGRAHVQNKGWLNQVGNGAVIGTTGKSLRLEAFTVSAPGFGMPGSIQIDSHVQDMGWTGYKTGTAGTVGKGKRLEAIRMKITGEASSYFDIYYRVHVSNIGWLAWASEDDYAGTSGMSARVEAVQVKVVKKNADPKLPSSASSDAFFTGTNIVYSANNQDYGWGSNKSNGGTAGVTGKSKRLEAYKVSLSGGTVGGSVRYNAYVAGSGWQGTVSANNVSGTIGKSKGLEAISIKLTGRAATMYDVYYRTHVSNAGWLGWAKNGQTAGAPGTGHNVEAYQVRLVSKGSSAPGTTSSHQIDKSYFDDPMVKKAQGYSSPTGWLILVDTANAKLCVLRGSRGSWKKYDKWSVTVGAPATPTVTGVYSVGSRGYSFGHGYTCYYWTEWNGAYLFHSILYDEGTFNVRDGKLGAHRSHGCVRCPLEKAKFIYDTIPSGTTVVTY